MHRVTVSVEEDDVLQRVALLNAAMFRILSHARLIRASGADYAAGWIALIIEGDDRTVPELEGEVKVRVERVPALEALRERSTAA